MHTTSECTENTPAPAPAAPPRRRRLWRAVRALFRTVRNLLALAMILELIMVFTPVPERLYAWFSVSNPNPAKADFIVCLGGGPGREAAAAQLWHQKVAPLVIVSNSPGAAEWMRQVVARCGVPMNRILIENQSYFTADHPTGVAKVPGVDPRTSKLVIVTDHNHTRRARDCFLKGGYAHVTMYAAREYRRDSYWDRVQWRVTVLPGIIYESAALATYWWQGKI